MRRSIAQGYVAVIGAMLDGGAAVDSCGPDGKTSLMMAGRTAGR